MAIEVNTISARNLVMTIVIALLYCLAAWSLHQFNNVSHLDRAVIGDSYQYGTSDGAAITQPRPVRLVEGATASEFNAAQATAPRYVGPATTQKSQQSNQYKSLAFLMLLAVITLAVTGHNNKPEFDYKQLLLSVLTLSSAALMNNILMLLIPALGIGLLYARRYLSPYLRSYYG
ncbi:hypothetical protein FLM48_03435 [Shewanella sp. Scap07]|uniref:hypothetical protein n=1 Tax=Shewanella sp. Scap07 TaxID=2589987 RepID=UPI0015BDAC58|nr:hypothetical protein [Shewanella sp. Scap07]QLE84218.1 hypothetical protein FLM48_03435 [Shewanella sp. Scap07]